MTVKNKFASAIKGNAPKPTAKTAPAAKAVTEGADKDAKEWKTPRTRKGRKAVTMYVTDDAHRALKILAIEQDKNLKELMNEAVDGLFRAYGKPPIN